VSTEWPFTPECETGGWNVERSDTFEGWYAIDEARDEQVCAYYDIEDGLPNLADAHDIANVSLIAAAPRMYRALKELIRYEDEELREDERLDTDEARSVIDWIDQR
jgi:hypothetical protein